MDLRIVFLLFFAVSIIAIIIISRRWKNIYLDKLQLLPDEKILFDDGCTVELKVAASRIIIKNTFVRITNKRIILAQKVIAKGNKYLLKYVIHYIGQPAPDGIGGGVLNSGYITYRAIPQNLSIQKDDDKSCFRVEPFESGMGIPVWLHIKTDHIEKYRDLFQLSQGSMN